MMSLVVCTHNPRPEYLSRCLDSLTRQSLDSSEYELLVVDNASNAPVAELEPVRRSGARVVHEPRRGLTAARECGAREAHGDLIVFADDDNVLDRDYLSQARALFSDSRIGVMSGEILPEFEKEPEPWFQIYEEWLAIRRLASEDPYLTSIPEVNRYFPIGAGWCIRRSILLEYFGALEQGERIEGRYGSRLSSGEDIDVDLFAVSRGFLVGASKRLRVVHLIPSHRTNASYLAALITGSLESLYQVNQKWRVRLGNDPLPLFSGSRISVAVTALASLARPTSQRHRLRFIHHAKLLRLISRRRRQASQGL